MRRPLSGRWPLLPIEVPFNLSPHTSRLAKNVYKSTAAALPGCANCEVRFLRPQANPRSQGAISSSIPSMVTICHDYFYYHYHYYYCFFLVLSSLLLLFFAIIAISAIPTSV